MERLVPQIDVFGVVVDRSVLRIGDFGVAEFRSVPRIDDFGVAEFRSVLRIDDFGVVEKGLKSPDLELLLDNWPQHTLFQVKYLYFMLIDSTWTSFDLKI